MLDERAKIRVPPAGCDVAHENENDTQDRGRQVERESQIERLWMCGINGENNNV